MAFPQSGAYWFPGGLTTVEIDREVDFGQLLGAERLDAPHRLIGAPGSRTCDGCCPGVDSSAPEAAGRGLVSAPPAPISHANEAGVRGRR
jgi:hypothetical protein